MSKVIKTNLLDSSQEIQDKTVNRITYHYPESMKKAKKKYEVKMKGELKVKLQTGYIDKISQQKMLKLASKFGGWPKFITWIIERASKEK